MIQIRDWLPFLGMPLMLLSVQIIAIILVMPMQAAGFMAFENPESVANPLIFIGILLIFTLVLLILIRLGGRRFIAVFIGFAIFMTLLYIFGLSSSPSAPVMLLPSGRSSPQERRPRSLHIPEWCVIDILGVLISAALHHIQISLAILPVLVLLVCLHLRCHIGVSDEA